MGFSLQCDGYYSSLTYSSGTVVTFFGILNMPFSWKKHMLVTIYYGQINRRFINNRQHATICSVPFPFLYIFLLENTWTTRADRNWLKLGTTRAPGVAIVCGPSSGHIDQGRIIQEFSFGDISQGHIVMTSYCMCGSRDNMKKQQSNTNSQFFDCRTRPPYKMTTKG
jgi:hypothetical protein